MTFEILLKLYLTRAQNQGGNTVALKRMLSKYFGHHFQVLQKFNNTFII